MGGCGCASYVQKGPSRRAGPRTRRSQSRSHAPRSGFCFANPSPIRGTTPHPSRPELPILGTHSISPTSALFPALSPTHRRHSLVLTLGIWQHPFPAPDHSLTVCTYHATSFSCVHRPARDTPLSCTHLMLLHIYDLMDIYRKEPHRNQNLCRNS